MNLNQIISLIFCLFAQLCAIHAAQNEARLPSVAVRLTSRGMDFLGATGHKLVTKELPKTQFPSITLPINSGPGSGQVQVTGLQIPANLFQSPKFRFKLSPPSAIQFTSSGGSVPVRGQWSAYYDLFYTNGWVDVLATDVESTLSLGVEHLKGKPQLDVFSCTADVSQLDVHIGGGVIPWLVNLFRAQLSAALKQTVHDQFCLTVKNTLLNQLNTILLSMPNSFSLGDSLFLNYSFDNETQVTRQSANLKPSEFNQFSTYMQALAFANLVVQNNSGCPIGPSSSMPLDAPLWLHGSVPNCLFWSLHNAGILQMVVDPSFDGGKFAKFLQTSCRIYQICLGRFLPELALKYPAQHVDFHFHSASPPIARIVAGPRATVNITARFFVDLHISPWKTHPGVLARLEMKTTAGVKPSLAGGKLKGEIDSMEVRFGEVSSSIGNFSTKFLNTFALLMKPLIEAVLKSSLQVGFPLPTVEGIQLAPGSQLVALVRSQQFRLDTDLVYANGTGLWLGI